MGPPHKAIADEADVKLFHKNLGFEFWW
jgi:hypothetical protein